MPRTASARADTPNAQSRQPASNASRSLGEDTLQLRVSGEVDEHGAVGPLVHHHAAGRRGGGPADFDRLADVIDASCAAAGDYRDTDRVRDGLDQLEVVAGHRSVPVDRREENLPCAKALDLARVVDRGAVGASSLQ